MVEESEECRVCRGEAEPDRPLYNPCMCSGSIMYTHEECLLQWLQHSGKDSCELCKYKFNFKPVYMEDAPQHVSARQVLVRCLRKGALEWLPFIARLILAAVLWLGVVPCITSWIYRIWIHRASVLVPDLIRRRLHGGGGAMLWNDAVSGIIIATFIIFSFLSLMSFGDFLRFHLDIREGQEEEFRAAAEVQRVENRVQQQPPQQQQQENEVRGLNLAEGPIDEQNEERRPENLPVAENAPVPIALPHLAGAADNNDNNNNAAANRAGGDVDGDMEVELHVAVDELMGIRGPFPFLVRNIIWLTAFNGAYLGLFAFIPYSVGAAVVGAAEKYVDSPLLRLLRFMVPESICDLALETSRAAAEDDHTLQLPDLGIILLGYFMMSAMVFTWRSIVCAICQRAALPMLRKVVRVLECTAAVVKVGLLLFLKMLFLPLLLGLWLDAATTQVLGPSRQERISFATENLVGALLLHWVAGITFMLFVTVSVLQLREVLHPDLLAKIIRPQEPQPDLLGSLLQESGLTHARRMAISLGIYVVLLFVFVWIPARLVSMTAAETAEPRPTPAAAAALFQLRTFYLAPQLQIPFELILFHLAMLAFLEHSKTIIGRMQHLWLRPFCNVLGLTRYLLPVSRIRISGTDLQAGPSRRRVEKDNNGELFLAGLPLRRPVWEEGTPEQGGRWAWGNEQVSEVERNVAPRLFPKFRGLRMAVLLFVSWLVILVLVGGGLALPLFLGRAVFTLLYIPVRYFHDPLAFAIGVGICYMVRLWVLRLMESLTWRAVESWMEQARKPCTRAASILGLSAALWLGLAPFLLGTLFEVTLVVPSHEWKTQGIASLNLLQDWLLGLMILHEWAYFSWSGYVDGIWIVFRPAQNAGRNHHQAALQAMLDTLSSILLEWDWSKATLDGLVRPFVWPLTLHLLELFFLPMSMGVLIAHVKGKWPQLLASMLPPTIESASIAEVQLSCFRLTVVAWISATLSMRSMEPVQKWFENVQTAVRDENYLVRLELMNYIAASSSSPPAANG